MNYWEKELIAVIEAEEEANEYENAMAYTEEMEDIEEYEYA